MPRKKTFNDSVPVSVLMPGILQRQVAKRAKAEERSFSAVVRRAVKRELGIAEDEISKMESVK